MPTLDSCLNSIYEPGFIPGDTGEDPTIPVLPFRLAVAPGRGSMRVDTIQTSMMMARFAGEGRIGPSTFSIINGPGASTDNAVVRFDGTSGNQVQNSGVIIDDSDNITAGNLTSRGMSIKTLAGDYTAIFPWGPTAGTNYAIAGDTSGADVALYINRPPSGTIIFKEGNGPNQVAILPEGTLALAPTLDTFTKGIVSVQRVSTAAATTQKLNQFAITHRAPISGADFLDGWDFSVLIDTANVVYGGTNVLQASLSVAAPTHAANTNNNYCAGTFVAGATSGDNGSNTGANAKGALFAMNPVSVLSSGATNWLGLLGMEMNIAVETGASTRIKTGIYINALPNDAVQGALIDTMIYLSNQGGPGWNDGILIGPVTDAGGTVGTWPIHSGGNIIRAMAGTCTNGINFSATTITGNAWASPNFNITGAGHVGVGTAATSTSFFTLAAGTTAKSALRFVQGVAPSAPVDGDMWREDNTNTGLKIRINGVTKTVTVA